MGSFGLLSEMEWKDADVARTLRCLNGDSENELILGGLSEVCDAVGWNPRQAARGHEPFA